MEREKLSSRLGFILLSAGCAIGCGNVWKFPYITGQFGGGMFVLIYLVCLVLLGLPIMTMEFTMGRASQKSPVAAYQVLEPKGSKWHFHGYAAMVGNYLLMMFYVTVSGWILYYCYAMAAGMLNGTTEQISGVFPALQQKPWTMIGFNSVVVVAGFLICSFKLSKGLEKVTKYMMIALLVIMVVLAIHSFTLEGGKAGLEFYLKPSIENMKAAGIGNVIVAAMNQSFFTLSLGIGSMAIFGSYIGKERSLMGESANVIALDTFVAIVAGLIIFPACFAYGVEPDAGPGLIFVTLPNIFKDMAGGQIWGTLFFVFMMFAAFSTVLAVFENIVAMCMDAFGWNRKKSCLVNGIAMLFLAVPAVLGFNVLSGFTPLGEGTGIFDLEDFMVSNLLLPLGCLCYTLFITNKKAFGWKKFTDEANAGKGLKVKSWMRVYMTYILPVIIAAIFVIGIIPFIQKLF